MYMRGNTFIADINWSQQVIAIARTYVIYTYIAVSDMMIDHKRQLSITFIIAAKLVIDKNFV
jgi:hypothetical protein